MKRVGKFTNGGDKGVVLQVWSDMDSGVEHHGMKAAHVDLLMGKDRKVGRISVFRVTDATMLIEVDLKGRKKSMSYTIDDGGSTED